MHSAKIRANGSHHRAGQRRSGQRGWSRRGGGAYDTSENIDHASVEQERGTTSVGPLSIRQGASYWREERENELTRATVPRLTAPLWARSGGSPAVA